MTNFGWWQSEVMAASNGTAFMCMICFDVFPVSEAYADVIGQKWDMCRECGEVEQPGPDTAGAKCCNGTGFADYASVPCPNPECTAVAEDRPERQRVTEVTPVPEYLSGAKLFVPTVAPALEGPMVPSGSRAAADAPNPSP
jgi:hypothetical protein